MNTGRHFENLAHLIYGLLGLLIILIGLIINLSVQPEETFVCGTVSEESSIATNFDIPETIQLGRELFKNKCASCHAKNMKAALTGPALAGVEDRWENKEHLYAWIKNAPAFLETGDVYATNLFLENEKRVMTPFPELEMEDIDAILAYINFVSNP